MFIFIFCIGLVLAPLYLIGQAPITISTSPLLWPPSPVVPSLLFFLLQADMVDIESAVINIADKIFTTVFFMCFGPPFSFEKSIPLKPFLE